MDLPIMVADCFRAVTNTARFSQRMLTYTASIVNVTYGMRAYNTFGAVYCGYASRKYISLNFRQVPTVSSTYGSD